jgi:hypothetical protein
MTERFYSGERSGTLTVRDGGGLGEVRPLQCRFDYRKYITTRNKNPDDTRLALTLLGDALEDERRAVEAHEYFMRRVIPLLPPRFTISRSRVLAYVNAMELERLTGTVVAKPGSTAEK